MSSAYQRIVQHYESCLRRHGEGPAAVDWKSTEDAAIRYDVMLGVIRSAEQRSVLLDFGCGLANLKDHMDVRKMGQVDYIGLDLSPDFVAAARARHPGVPFFCMDAMLSDNVIPEADYTVMNGVFTRRHDLSFDEMQVYMAALLARIFAHCRVGLAFNVMSKCVDWESESLFHVCPGELAKMICNSLSKHFVIRNDYGLYETTCYVYRDPIG